jgi:hypothetical protein
MYPCVQRHINSPPASSTGRALEQLHVQSKCEPISLGCRTRLLIVCSPSLPTQRRLLSAPLTAPPRNTCTNIEPFLTGSGPQAVALSLRLYGVPESIQLQH